MMLDKIDLGELFNMPCETIRTNGVQDGVVLKFASFYLKIYDAEKKDSYIVEGYRYGISAPIFTDCVPYKHMRRYAGIVTCIIR